MNQITLHSPQQAHQALKDVWHKVKPLLVGGRKQVLEIRDYEDRLSEQQRKYYHGYILTQIAQQARIDDNKYPMQVWKEHFRNKHLGDKVESIIDPMNGTVKKEVVRVSTESLGVKKYTLLIEQVTAFAVTDLNVNFDLEFDEWAENND